LEKPLFFDLGKIKILLLGSFKPNGQVTLDILGVEEVSFLGGFVGSEVGGHDRGRLVGWFDKSKIRRES